MKNIAIISDNNYLTRELKSIIYDLRTELNNARFIYFNTIFNRTPDKALFERSIDVPSEISYLESFDLILSLHCKQLFPVELVKSTRCINIHPGLNPLTRGWFPQVFAIVYQLPAGVTIHEMDEKLDHGSIIVTREIEKDASDTSKTLYDRVLETEIDMLRLNLVNLVNNKYETQKVTEPGNLFLKEDYNKLLEIDTTQTATMGELIDLLRATTHPPYNNAFMKDKDGNKIYISITLQK